MEIVSNCLSCVRLMILLSVGACAAVPEGGPPPGQAQDVAKLAQAIRALGPDVDPEEAQRAAHVAYDYTYQLAQAYQITDPPLVHNTKVNLGLKPRGLCWHWAHDMEKRLAEEHFTTLALHRGIANADNPFRLEHSAAIVSRRGGTMFEGIVLDPWRKGGRLTWVKTRKDRWYHWRPREEVLAKKLGPEVAQRLLVQAGVPEN